MYRLVTATRRLAVVSLCALLVTAFEGRAVAQSIFVDAAGPGWRRKVRDSVPPITDAVVEARSIGRTSNERIIIHVAAGNLCRKL